MRLFAFAALLAIPFLAIAAPAAKADYYCCGNENGKQSFVKEDFHVIKEAVVFGCDGYHCETAIRLLRDVKVEAKCRNGWCKLVTFPLENAWVLESCLKPLQHYSGGYPKRVHEPEYSAPYSPGPGPGYDRRY